MGATQASTPKVYQQYWKEWEGWCVQEGAPNSAISAPKLADVLVHLFRIGWPGIQLVYIFLVFLLFFGALSSSKGF